MQTPGQIYQIAPHMCQTAGSFYQTAQQIVQTRGQIYQIEPHMCQTAGNFYQIAQQIVQTRGCICKIASRIYQIAGNFVSRNPNKICFNRKRYNNGKEKNELINKDETMGRILLTDISKGLIFYLGDSAWC